MMNILKKTGTFLLIVFILIQFFSIDKNEGNYNVKTDFITVNNTPMPIANSLKKACYDCHSNKTNYPWYSHIQPVAWFLKHHVDEGKEELNLSLFENYSLKRKKKKISEMIEEIEEGEMPLSSYTLIHKEAVFTTQEKETLIHYLKTLLNTLDKK